MDKLRHPLVTVPVKFGLIGGGIGLLMFLVTYFMGKNPLIDNKFFDFIILPIFLFFTMKEFRDFRNHGFLHFWQGMTAGVLMYLTMAVFSAIVVLIFLEWIDPVLLDNYINDRIAIIDLKKEEMIQQMGEETYLQSRTDVMETTSLIMALDDFLKKCLIGLTLTIPLAVILRRREL